MGQTLLFVKPAADAKVRHEDTRQSLHPRGAWWADTPYVRRRLRDGDLVEAAPEEPQADQPAAAADAPADDVPAASSKPKAPRPQRSSNKPSKG